MLKCCCIGFAIFLAVNTLLLVATTTAAYFWTKRQVVRLTVENPLPEFPIVELSQTDFNVIKDRAALFFDTIMAVEQEAPDDLVLSSHEFNGLIGYSDFPGYLLRGNINVDIQQGVFSVQMSLPATYLPGGKGRYFVATFRIQNVSPHKVLVALESLDPISDLDGPIFMLNLHISQDESTGNWTAFVDSFAFMGLNAYAPTEPEFLHLKDHLLINFFDDAQVLNGISGITIEKDKIVIQARNTCVDFTSPKLPFDNTTTHDKGVVYALPVRF